MLFSMILLFVLVKIFSHDSLNILQWNQKRLHYTYRAVQIDAIELEHKALYGLYHQRPSVKGSIDSLDDGDSFDAAWTNLCSTDQLLESFVGGMESIFPGTSTVEGNFLVITYEKNNNCTSLSDVSLEFIIHTMQYRRTCSLNIWF